MTEKDKAKELIEKFSEVEMPPSCDRPMIGRRAAIACSLICVEEILNAYEFGGASSTRDINYWQAVKTEIQNYHE